MSETVIAKASRTFPAPKGYGRATTFRIDAQAYQLGGNSHPHFSVTGEISRPGADDCEACGCLHEEAVKAWPQVKPIIDLHLSNADDGAPMHAVANGFYDLAGAATHHFGEKYHRGNSEMNFPIKPPSDKPWQNTEYRRPTQAECLTMLAEHLRVSEQEVETVFRKCIMAYAGCYHDTGRGNKAAKQVFAEFCDTLRDQWKREAEEGIALIKSLA